MQRDPHTAAGASASDRPEITYGRGPIETEELLLDELDRRLDEAGPGIPRRLTRIVVPSKSLRLHLLARLVHRRGGPVAGIECETLHALAERIVRDAGFPGSSPIDLFPILTRRLAAADPGLRRSLGHLRDGYGTILGSVRDLLDAGFGPAHLEALEDLLRDAASREIPRELVERTLSIARIAAATAGGLESHELGRNSTLLATAAELVRHEAATLPPTTSLVVHGFSDATGVATDLLEALLLRTAGRLFLDQPPDPAQPEATDPGAVFGRRFAERMEAAAGTVRNPPESPRHRPTIRMLAATGRVAEVRAVADAVLDLLATGTEAETIGIVARDLDGYRLCLRTHLGRAGVPFSGVGSRGPLGPAGRRIRAMLDLLTRRARVPIERWLDARESGFGGVHRFELRLALHALGAGKLEDAAALRLDPRVFEDGFPLPIRRAFQSVESDETEMDAADGRTLLRRRRISGKALAETIEAARSLSQRLGGLESRRSMAVHLAELRGLLDVDLDWNREGRAARALDDVFERVLEPMPGNLELDSTEMALVLEEELRHSGASALGGAGGGVQVLDVTEARQRTFEHLFVLGLNRGEFPREIREDPILPDSIRKILGREGHGILPDLPMKRMGHHEERFLFAQLVAAAPTVTLLWRRADENGTGLAPSPLVERIRWSREPDGSEPPEPGLVLPLFEGADPDKDTLALQLYTAAENAIAAGLRGVRGSPRAKNLSGILSLALDEASLDLGAEAPPPSTELASARLEAFREWDGGFELRGALSPLLGFAGPSAPWDPRALNEIWVTTLEAFFRCPWKSFLERLLRVEPLPDPLEALPGLDRLLIGVLVHRAAEEIVHRSAPGNGPENPELEEVLTLPGTRVPWPEAAEVENIVRSTAEDVVRREGLVLPGFAAVLARASLPFLERLRQADWNGGGGEPTVLGVEVLGVEVPGQWRLPDPNGPRLLRFRADRVDSLDGSVRLSDYKTGSKVLSTAVKPETRRNHLLREVSKGLSLQATAYAMAAGAIPGGEGAHGRYLYLDPDLEVDDELREVVASAEDETLMSAFAAAVSTGASAWQTGVFVPRLIDTAKDQEPRACDWCDVAEACVRGDSGLRARLRAWIDAHSPNVPDGRKVQPGPMEETLIRLWWQGTEESP